MAGRRRKGPAPIQVACAGGCGRTAFVRPSKIEPCVGYTCNLGSCTLNGAFKIPPPPDEHHVAIVPQAAGGFSGWRYEPDTPEHLAAVARAKDILERGLKRLREMN